MGNPLRTKSVEQSIQDTDEPESRLRKDLTWWDLTVFGVSVVIGAGIFTITASTAGNLTGPAISVSFVIAAVTCGLAALCYAEFASTLPVAGSAYTFSYATFGEFTAWVIGWDVILELAVGGAGVAKGWSRYVGTVFGFSGGTAKFGPVTLDWGALLIIAILATLLALGTKLSSNVSAVITLVKVAVVVLVVVVGAFYIKVANFSPFVPPGQPNQSHAEQSVLSLLTGASGSDYGWYGVLAGASIVFFAFIGFDVVATTAEETKNPQRDVPRGILATLAIVTVLYVAVSVVLSGMVRYTELKDKAGGGHANLATAFKANGVNWAAEVVAIGALAGRTTVVVGVLIAVAASVFPIGKLEEMVNVGTLFAFALVSGGVIILRRTRPDLPRGFRAPWVPAMPIASIIACLWLMLNLTLLTWIRFVVWMLIGMVVYFGYGRRHSVLATREAAQARPLFTKYGFMSRQQTNCPLE